MDFTSLENIFLFFNRSNMEIIKDLQKVGLLVGTLKCRDKSCRSSCNLKRSVDYPLGYVYICSKCSIRYTVIKKSIFQGTKLEIKNFFYITWHWSCLVPSNIAANILYLPRQSIFEEYKFLSNVCSWKISQETELLQLGGVGKIVQVDSIIVSRKRNGEGRMIASRWVLGLFDIEDNKGVIVNVEDQDAKVISRMIRKHVLPGSEIWTDSSTGFSDLATFDTETYVHRKFKTPNEFVNPNTGQLKNFAQEYCLVFMKFCRRLGVLQTHLVTAHVDRFMWTQCYGTTPSICCKNIITHIVEYYKSTRIKLSENVQTFDHSSPGI